MGKKENEEKRAESENSKSPRINRIHAMCIIAVFVALMCVLSPLSIPLEPISITLATLVVYLIGAVFSWKISLPIILIYLLLGMAGMPVFSKFQGGIQVLAGPTGGFLIGYVPCLLFESLLLGKTKKRLWTYPLAMLGGTFLLYACGVAWFLIYGKGNYGFAQAMMVCVVPFLLGDAIKIMLASFAGYRLRKFVDGEFGNPW